MQISIIIRRLGGFLAAGCLILTSGCRLLPPAAGHAAPVPISAAERLAAAEQLLAANRLEEAQEQLAPLVREGQEKERTGQLLATINERLAQQREKAAAEDPGRKIREEDERFRAIKAVNEQILEIESLIRRGDFEEAKRKLAALRQQELFQQDVAMLDLEIQRCLDGKADQVSQKNSENQALREVDRHLVLPASYGKTVIIAADADDSALPPGPMEQLVARKVSMKLQDAGIKEILAAFGALEGLNFIADQALKEERRLTVEVKDVPLRDLLLYISRNMGMEFHVSENVVWVTAAQKKSGGANLETRIYKLRRGLIPTLDLKTANKEYELPDTAKLEDKELEDVLKMFVDNGTEGALFKIFPSRNLLVVRQSRDQLRLVEELLRSFDHEPLQVLIEARFVTIRQNDLFRLGVNINRVIIPPKGETVDFNDLALKQTRTIVQLDAAGRPMTITEPVPNSLSAALANKRLEAFGEFPGNLTLSGILGNTTYQAVLDAIKQNDTAKTLSVPRITVVNNRPARIHRGSKRYYFEEYDLATVDLGDLGRGTKLVPTGKPKEMDLGFLLDVKANIGHDSRTLVLALRPEITEFSGWDEFDSARLPILDQNELFTTVVVNSGETVVLGGTISKLDTESVKSVPFLGDIPILGYLFRWHEKIAEPQHLLIFVTATVISNSGEFLQTESAPAAKPGSP